ncbi:MAG: threonine synthase [Verrucomicrobia bacterium]|nr:threonine synthase [Verrucomicrobiota bacterium]MBV9130613.1 threonine synthase [Verrucomicrobiota bacterium]
MKGSLEAPGATIGVIERYREHLPVTEATPVFTLSEGSTPLVHSPRLSAIVGRGCRVYLKYEGLNPTGSFKDRGMTVAVSKAAESGAHLVICASTGNTSAAAAAYAARAGIKCAVFLPCGKIAMGKLAQAFVHGAVVIAIEGNFDQCLKLVREMATEPGISIVNSVNPYRLEGQKTAAFEVIDALGDAPHLHVLPVGNAGNTTAYWRGYLEYHRLNRATRLPRMLGFEAAGAAPIYYDRVVEYPETAASAIRIGNPASWKMATAAFRESGGAIEIITDEEIFAAQSWLASKEGLFVEPASAAPIAGLFKCRSQTPCAGCPIQKIPDDAVIVCTLTGHGLKDTAAVLNERVKPLAALPEKAAILSILDKAK